MTHPRPEALAAFRHEVAAMHYRVLARNDASGHAAMLATVHAELALGPLDSSAHLDGPGHQGEAPDVRVA